MVCFAGRFVTPPSLSAFVALDGIGASVSEGSASEGTVRLAVCAIADGCELSDGARARPLASFASGLSLSSSCMSSGASRKSPVKMTCSKDAHEGHEVSQAINWGFAPTVAARTVSPKTKPIHIVSVNRLNS